LRNLASYSQLSTRALRESLEDLPAQAMSVAGTGSASATRTNGAARRVAAHRVAAGEADLKQELIRLSTRLQKLAAHDGSV
jgi:hypothetical protein